MLKLPTRKIANGLVSVTIMREIMLWLMILPAAFAVTWFWSFYNAQPAKALVVNNALLFYGDTVNAGIMRGRVFTPNISYAAEFNGITGAASNILQTVARTAPTREEMMIGSLRVSGELQLESCNAGCDANGDFTNQWANAGTSATLDCDNTSPAADQCLRPFDLDYESLRGRTMVAYADNVADKFYYAYWDGSAWGPDSSPASPSATNEVDFHTGGTGGTPQWIRVISDGERLDADRSNRIMVLISDTNEDLWACYWDDHAFSCLASALEASLQNCGLAQCFDGAWTSSDRFVAVYYDTAASTMRYQIFTVTTNSWGGEQDGPALSSAGQWITAVQSPVSSRILVATSESGDDERSTVWRGDNATDGWTTCAVTDCPDTSTETVSGVQSGVAFERFNGDGLHAYNDAGTASSADYNTYVPTATWGNATSLVLTTSDDPEMIRVYGSPNNDNVVIISLDVDCDTDTQTYSGGVGTVIATQDADNSSYGVACPGPTTPGTDPSGAGRSYDLTFKPYSPWQRNWRFYSGADTASIPTTALANQNTGLTGFNRTTGKFRLRINYAERGTRSSIDHRRKLQYTSNCNPNVSLETSCTWTDVDDAAGAGIWRYDQDADLACTATDCDDGVLLTGTVLTGTEGTCSAGNGCGTWVMDKDAAPGANMDHNGAIIQESEYVVEANGAAQGTLYFFRLFDVDQLTPVYREQDADDCAAADGGSVQCTYPSIKTDGTTTNVSENLMRHGKWFDLGVEQNFFWAN